MGLYVSSKRVWGGGGVVGGVVTQDKGTIEMVLKRQGSGH